MSVAMIETGGGGVETDKNSRLLYLYGISVIWSVQSIPLYQKRLSNESWIRYVCREDELYESF